MQRPPPKHASSRLHTPRAPPTAHSCPHLEHLVQGGKGVARGDGHGGLSACSSARSGGGGRARQRLGGAQRVGGVGARGQRTLRGLAVRGQGRTPEAKCISCGGKQAWLQHLPS